MEHTEPTAEATLSAARKREPPREPLLESVSAAIEAHSLLPAGSAIVVAVSGGADSVALLDVLRQLAPSKRWRLHVAHVNHGLRGAESDADAGFAAHCAARAGVPCTVRAVDAARAQQDHASPENSARRLRYQALAAIAREVGARFIALAHHQDDQAETVLLHLLRGSGLGGLAGMGYASPLPLAAETEPPLRPTAMHENGRGPARPRPEAAVTLARPLLDVARADLRAYCARRGLAFREDSSNADTAPQRNWLRHVALPLLETRYPAAARTLARAAHVLAEDHAYLTGAAEDWLRRHAQRCDGGVLLDGPAWRALEPALQTAALRRAIARIAGHTQGLEYAHVANARAALREGRTGAAAPLPGGLLCRAEHDGIWIGYAPPREPFAPVPLRIPGRTAVAALGCSIDITIVEPGQADFQAGTAGVDAWLDAARVTDALSVRTRRPGDRFTPLGMTGAKKLQDFLVDARVPARQRDRVPLVVTAQGAIVWVAGHRIDARYRITEHTRQALHLRLETLAAESLGQPEPAGENTASPWRESQTSVTPSPWGEADRGMYMSFRAQRGI